MQEDHVEAEIPPRDTPQNGMVHTGETDERDAEFTALLAPPGAATTILTVLAWARRHGLTLEQLERRLIEASR